MTIMKKWGKILIINLGILSIILISIEIIVRLIFPEITPLGISEKLFQKQKYGHSFGFVPNVSATAYGINIKTDNDGFIIDSTLPSDNNDGKLPKILFLGDSISVGVALEPRDSFPFILQRKINNYKIINSSVIGYAIEDYYNVLEVLLKKGYDFEGVILCLCINDISFYSKININKSLGEKQEEYLNIMFQNFIVRFLKKVSEEYIDFNAVLRKYSRTYLLMKSKLVDSSRGYFLADLEPYNKPNAEQYIREELNRSDRAIL